jgi:hypothetical protein
MRIRIHIDEARFIGFVGRFDRAQFQASLEAEFGRLIATGGLPPRTNASWSTERLVAQDPMPSAVDQAGRWFAQQLYGSLQ